MNNPQTWQVITTRRAERKIRRLPKDLIKRLRKAIDALGDNPRPPGYKKLTGTDLYRIRVGSWRIIYTIEDDQLIVLVVTIAPRGSAYRNL